MVILALLTGLAFADHPAGSEIAPSVALQLNEDGLASLSQILPAMVPADPVMVDSTSDESGWGCLGYAYGIDNVWVGLEVTGATITPQTGYLNVDLDLDVWVNNASDKFTIDYEALCIGETCPGYVEPFPVKVSLPFALTVVKPPAPALPYFDAQMGQIQVVHNLTGDDIQLDCAIGTIEDVLNIFNLSLFDLIIGLMQSVIEDQVAGMQGDLEATIADALSAASIVESLDINGTVVDLKLVPDDVSIAQDGMEIFMLGAASAEQAACVVDKDSGGSLKTDGALPGLDEIPASSQMAIQVADDFANQLLYAVWRGGVLCFEADEDTLDGLPLDSSMLTLIGGEPYAAILPSETKPLILRTEPEKPPVIDLDGDDDVNVLIEDLYVSFYTELDHRVARALRVDLDVDAGVNLNLDTTTGELGIDLQLGTEAITATVADDVLVKGHEEAIAEGVAGVFGSVVEPLIGGLVGDSLAFPLPVFGTTGLTAISVEATGPDEDWMGVYAGLGEVTYAGASCDDTSGSSCGESGCSVTGGGGFGWMLALFGALLRRRRTGANCGTGGRSADYR
jgi:MYXO-CTERM domain-containing protein